MTLFVSRAAALLRIILRFAHAGEAVAAVEFALVMPLLLALYLGSVEITQLISVDQRVTNVAATVGDLVAREKNEIPSSDLTNYFQAASSILTPFTSTGLVQTVSLVYVNSTGVTKVLWTVPSSGTSIQTVGQPWTGTHPIPASMIAISYNNWVVVSEASYPYTPLGLYFQNTLSLYHQAFYLPRYASMICYNTATCASS